MPRRKKEKKARKLWNFKRAKRYGLPRMKRPREVLKAAGPFMGGNVRAGKQALRRNDQQMANSPNSALAAGLFEFGMGAKSV
jgi:hypothetical protein